MIGRSVALALALVLCAPAARAEEGNIFSNLLKYGGTTVPPSRGPELEPAYCPQIDLRDGAAAQQTLGGRGEGAAGIRSQTALSRLARECARLADGSVGIRVGLEAKVLLGPGGAPGRFDVPVFIAIKHNEKVVSQRNLRIAVTVPPGEAQGFASTVEEGIVVPAALAADYEIEVAVGGSGKTAKAKPRRKPAAAPAGESGDAGAAR